MGSEICRLLAATGKPFSGSCQAHLRQKQVAGASKVWVPKIARGNLRDGSSLEAACKGVNAVISTASATVSRQEGDSIQTVDLGGQLNLIDAAKAAGVNQFILISFSPSAIEFPLQAAKRAVEKHLKQSGISYTILQPTCFMEVWLSPALGFDAANAKAQIYGSGREQLVGSSF